MRKKLKIFDKALFYADHIKMSTLDLQFSKPISLTNQKPTCALGLLNLCTGDSLRAHHICCVYWPEKRKSDILKGIGYMPPVQNKDRY